MNYLERWIKEGNNFVVENVVFFEWILSMMEYVKFCWNLGGLFFKVKYFLVIDSELVLWGKGEKYFGRGVK